MAGRLAGKTALITGGGSGIGRETALRFAAEGVRLVVADIDLDSALNVVARIEEDGGSALPVHCDVCDEKQVDGLVETVVDAFERIDVLFNCAGGSTADDGPVTELILEEFWRTIRVDLFGTLLTCRRVIPEMVKSKGGSIINMTSIRAIIGTVGADAYTASKGGVLSMSRAMAMQWADRNIRVNVLAPGVVLTERVAALVEEDDPIIRKTLLGPSEPADVASMALFLASDESRKITGTVMRIDGGASIF